MKITIKTLSKLAACLITFALSTSPQAASFDGVHHRDWQEWSFDYQVSGDFDGLSLTNVKYKGVDILNKASLPVMRVFYDNDVCGPYADRMGGNLTPISWANNNVLALREFTQSGRQWLELGIQDTIGNYVIYQAWYLSADGVLDGHIFSKGLQCNVDHVHYPYWRMDFDLAGDQNDQIRRFVNGNWQTISTESNESVTTADNHRWQIRDTVTGDSVDIEFGSAGWDNIDGTVSPVDSFNNNRIFGRRYKSSEDEGWRYGAQSEVPHDNNENISSQDILLWYKGYLPHDASEGQDLWHSTGVRFVINLADTNQNNAPTISPLANQTNQAGDSINLQINANDSDGDTLSYSASGLPAGLSVNNNTGLISGTIATTTTNNYNVTVSVNDGTTTVDTSFLWSVSVNGSNVIRYDFENNQGWSTNPDGDDTATTGQWERANPENTSSNGTTLQLGNAVNGQNVLVTGALAGTSVGTHDIDNGITSIQSPDIIIPSNSQVTITFSYYLAHLDNASSADFLHVIAVGNSSTTLLEELGGNNNDAANWAEFSGSLDNFAGQTIHLKIEAADSGSGSLVEAAIDNVVITIVENNQPNQPPVISNPGNRTNSIGDDPNITITASDGDGDELVFNATDLPPGASINSATGLISGTLTAAGNFSVNVTVSDENGGTDNTTFNWTVTTLPPGGQTISTSIPILMDSDDVEERSSGSVVLRSLDLDLVASGGNQTVGLRFNGINIPQGSTIVNAYIQFTAANPRNTVTSLTVHGQATDNASTFVNSVNGNVSTRPTTTASAQWTPAPWTTIGDAGNDQRTPDLSSIVQEIVNRSGWASNHSLALIITGTGKREAVSFDNNQAQAPVLHIEYSDNGNGGSANTAPTVSITSPVSGDNFNPGDNISLSATSTDTEDGNVTSQLSWTSNLDGVIGNGGSFTTSSLSEGTHTITASVSDSGGLSGSNSITIRVAGSGGQTTLTIPISAGLDDVEEKSSGSVIVGSIDLDLVASGGNQTVGLRFNGINIPPGSTIVDAYIQFTTSSTRSSLTSLILTGEATNNATGFVKVDNNVSARQTTSASVPWSPAPWTVIGEAGLNQRTPNIKSIIQEIVNRAGWASNNSLAFFVTGTGKRDAVSFETNASDAPVLHLVFSQ